jgi:TfoX/Sxy family transcriptional regulator of competence genes
MAYNQQLATRIEGLLQKIDPPGLTSKKMFGGIGYLVHGNMACGVHKQDMMVRTGPDLYETAMGKPHTRVFDMTGKVMTGWVVVDGEGVASDEVLEEWVKMGLAFARSLPAK